MTDAIANIILDVAELPDRNSPEGWPAAMIVTGDELRMIIERHLAAGQQGAGDDDVLEMLCRLERLAVVHRVNGSVEWKLLVEQAADMIRHLATPQPPKPADLCANCAADGRCMKRQALCVANGTADAKPAGDVPLPMFPIESEGSYWSTTEIEVIRAYGNAREAAARDAGRADAVPAWFCELPAPISNPEAWPANYAGGYNDALNMCYDVIRGHAPQQMTTQGEAVATVCLIGERYAHGTMIEVQLQIVPGTELPIGTKLYAGSQP